MKKRTASKIRMHMLTSYMKMFCLSLTILLMVYLILILSNQYIKEKLISQKYDIEDYLYDCLERDYSQIVDDGGGIILLDKELNIIRQEGLNFLNSEKLTPDEWANLLMNFKAIDSPYNYKINYSEDENSWLIIAFPSSVRMMFSFYYNENGTIHDKSIIIPFLLSLMLVLLLTIFLFAWLFTRITAKSYSRPIIELESHLTSFSEGTYKRRIDFDKTSILANLANTYNLMADRIQSQIEIRRELILDISHDIKNPLMSCLGYCEYLMNNPEISEDRKFGYYKIIYNDSLRAVKLADDLLQLSKLEIDEVKIDLHKIDICEFVRAEIATKIPLLDEHQFEYEFNIPSESVCCTIDRELFSRVIDNLISNTLKYNSAKTKIWISVIALDQFIRIIFEDDGIGIPKELHGEIAKAFVRGETDYQKVQGSGLGLSIVEKIVARHHGRFLIDSDRNSGCKFIIELKK